MATETAVAVIAPEVEKNALSWPEQARALAVVDQLGYDSATEALRKIKSLSKEIADHHRPVITAAHATWKAAIAAEKRLLDPLTQAEGLIKPKLVRFLEEQERLRQEEQRRQEEEARRQADEEALAAAILHEEEAKASGLSVEEIEQETLAILDSAPEMTVPVVAPKTFEPARGVSMSYRWEAEVTDLKALCKAVADGTAQVALVLANLPALNNLAKALKDAMKVPGVKAVKKPSIAARGR